MSFRTTLDVFDGILPYCCVAALQHMKQHSWRYAITTASDAAITNTLEDLGYAIAERSSDYFGHRITPAGEQYLKSMLN